MFRIVINFGSFVDAYQNIGRIEGIVCSNADTVLQGGHLLEVKTEHPEKFISSFFEEGFLNTFTCQMEKL